MYRLYIADIRFPVTPGSVSVEIGDKNVTYDLQNEGEIVVPKNPGLIKVSFEILLPNHVYPFAYIKTYSASEQKKGIGVEGKVKNADYYFAVLSGLKTSKRVTKVRFLKSPLANASESKKNRNIMGNEINMDAVLSDFSYDMDQEEYGDDLHVSVTFTEYRDAGLGRVTLQDTVKTTTRKDTTKETKYTVKTGDTLKTIAKKLLGSSSYADDIYKLNKTTIENAAKKNKRKSSVSGKYLYKGTVLKIPQKTGSTIISTKVLEGITVSTKK